MKGHPIEAGLIEEVLPEIRRCSSARAFLVKRERSIFWNDFAGCSIEKSPIQAESIPEDHRYQFGEFLSGLEGPKVVLSADGGTALIEWSIIDTDACCGHRATVRWIIGKSGAVMRHRHTTPGMC